MQQVALSLTMLLSLIVCVTLGPALCNQDNMPLGVGNDVLVEIKAQGSINALALETAYLPCIANMSYCRPIDGVTYEAIWVTPPPTDRPAEIHADLNLAMRSYAQTGGYAGLVDINGAADSRAPQLPGLFTDSRTPIFDSVYQVHDWDWGCNCRGNLITSPSVTLLGMRTTPSEIIQAPPCGYSIGEGFQALVLYANQERITLKYTRDDNVIHGYTIHIENICVEPSLLALYQDNNASGRAYLPALRGEQPLGRATDTQIRVAIRDSGGFMDPRSRKDWWQGR